MSGTRKNSTFYRQAKSLVLTEKQLKDFGYPFPHPTVSGRAVVGGAYLMNRFCPDPIRKICCRCEKVYRVQEVNGDYVEQEVCQFHAGRYVNRKYNGYIYTCCGATLKSKPGCAKHTGHVADCTEDYGLNGFIKTNPIPPPSDGYYGVYVIDCEMSYTTAGLELTKVTVLDQDFNVAYDSLVKPKYKILDYNTRFSGITEKDLMNVNTTLSDVQRYLLSIFNDQTILIGHGLDHDLLKLKIIHFNVIDTSVLFPHPRGLPFKRSLKTLAKEKLHRNIQDKVGGHDSKEDAVACLDLVLWKIRFQR